MAQYSTRGLLNVRYLSQRNLLQVLPKKRIKEATWFGAYESGNVRAALLSCAYPSPSPSPNPNPNPDPGPEPGPEPGP